MFDMLFMFLHLLYICYILLSSVNFPPPEDEILCFTFHNTHDYIAAVFNKLSGHRRAHQAGHAFNIKPNHSFSWWRHQMETFSAQLVLCAGNSPVPVNSPHKGQWRGALMFSLICVYINGWVNNREAGDLRRHYSHYDVNVMCWPFIMRHGGDWSKHIFYELQWT